MRRVFDKPSLCVSDVWSDMVGITIEQPPIAGNGRPSRWDITVYDGNRMIQSFQIPAVSLVEHVRIDHGLEFSREVRVSVRGMSAAGAGQEAVITQRLLPPPALRQQQILPDALQLHWYFPDWPANDPFSKLVSKYEIAVASDEYAEEETRQEFICSYDGEGDCLQGNALVRLAPHLLREASNFPLYGRVRCFSSRNHVWGQWSERTRLLCLSPLHVELRSVTSQSMVFMWGRNSSEAGKVHPSVLEADVSVDRMEVIAWPARSSRQPVVAATENTGTKATEDSAALPPLSVSTGQTRVFGPNIALLEGLAPNVVYNVCCRWKQLCGGDWHRLYFRASTRPEPEIVAIPTIGHSFIDVQWAPRGQTRNAKIVDLTEYVDDNFEAGSDPCPSFTLCEDVGCKGALDLHRLTISDGIVPIKVMDVRHAPEHRVQRYRMEGLPSGTCMRVTVRTASYFEVDGASHWSWGRASHTKVVTTVSYLRMIPQERGPNFMVLLLQCDPTEPVRSLTQDSFFVEEDVSMRPNFIVPHIGMYAVAPIGEGDVSVESFPDTGDLKWGISGIDGNEGTLEEKVGTTTPIRLDSIAKVQLTDLRANWTYRFSINVKDSEGRWWGKASTAFLTSSEDLIYVRPYVDAGPEQKLRIDQAYHDRMFGAAACVAIRYPVVIGEQRKEELSVSTAMLPSRLQSVALRTQVTSVGSDHCVLSWNAFAIADGLNGDASVLKQQGDLTAQHAKAFNTAPYALYEYRMKLFVSMVESSRLASQRERGVIDTTRSLYFRSAVRSAKVLGLEEGYRYRITLSYFNVVSQKWSPWSELVSVMPADRLSVSPARISHGCITYRWKRLIVPPIDRDTEGTGQSAVPSAPIRYDVRVQRYLTEADRSEPLDAAKSLITALKPEYDVRDIACGLIAVSARPWFDADSCGPFSAPCYVSVAPLKVMSEFITQSTATIRWNLPPVTPVPGGKGRIIINLASPTGNSRTTIDIGPFESRHVLRHLAPSTSYMVSAVQMVEVTVDSVPHIYDNVDPSCFDTLGPLEVSVAEVGEDFAVLRWPRRNLQGLENGGSNLMSSHLTCSGDEVTLAGEGKPLASADTSTCLASPIRPAAANLSNEATLVAACVSPSGNSKRYQGLHERYELVVEDYDFGHEERMIVPCTRTNLTYVQQKVTGLLPGGSYRARVRIDSEAAFFSEDILFRTVGPLTIRYTSLGVGKGTVECLHPLLPVGLPSSTTTFVAVKVPTEIKLEELPRAPSRHLTGNKAALALSKSRRTYTRRHMLPANSNTLELHGLPPAGTVLTVSARQQSAAGLVDEWLPWCKAEIML